MQDTAIKAGAPVPGPSPSPPVPSAPPAPASKKNRRGPILRAVEFCASLRVTVVLFVLAFLLVFFGTWAQVDAGIWTVVNTYFRWWYVYVPFKILLFRTIDIPESYGMPFPGGWTLGALLLINLLAAHAVRFKLSWKRSGILILHAGLIAMMLGEFLTGVFAIEGHMTIAEGYKSNYVESDRHYELAVVDRSNLGVEDEVRIPGSFLREGAAITDPELPFDITVDRYMANSVTRRAKEEDKNPATAGIGQRQIALPRKEVAGVKQGMEFPAAYITLRNKTSGASLGTYLVSTWFSFLDCRPDAVAMSGKDYQIVLRPKRTYRDYTIQLDKFQHKKFVGTEVPKDYRSFVHLIDLAKSENRPVEIYMNHPLYYRGETFYQSGLHTFTKGTVLQAVRNWSWWLPYVSCALVAGGMLIHFSLTLFNFLRVQGAWPAVGVNAKPLTSTPPTTAAPRRNRPRRPR